MTTSALPRPAHAGDGAGAPAAAAPRAVAAPVLGTRIRGIEELLPPGERVLWVGRPDRRSVARDVLHVRAVAAYFAVLLLLPLAGSAGSVAGTLARAATLVGPVALTVVAFAAVLAVLVSRTTVYALTDRRVVMRVGIALPVTINLPLADVVSADLRPRRDGRGDIALAVDPAHRIAYLLLWPHARPWRLSHPQPTLLGVENVAAVARLLGEALEATREPAAVVAAPTAFTASVAPDAVRA